MKIKLIGLVGAVFCLLISIATSRAATPVEAIEDLAITVYEMNLQNGIENSLDKKLEAALEALDDANVNNDVAACNTMTAFINAVEAQRGSWITDAQANELIARSEGIRSLLNCDGGCVPVMWYEDKDMDGYYVEVGLFCTAPFAGASDNAGSGIDCDDDDAFQICYW